MCDGPFFFVIENDFQYGNPSGLLKEGLFGLSGGISLYWGASGKSGK